MTAKLENFTMHDRQTEPSTSPERRSWEQVFADLDKAEAPEAEDRDSSLPLERSF